MKQVSFYFVTLAMLGLTACSSDNIVEDGGGSSDITKPAQVQTPIQVGAYVGRAISTRAGEYGEINGTGDTDDAKKKDALVSLANHGGFGLFGYYSNAGDYVGSGDNALYPDFMYNQLVEPTDEKSDGKYNSVTGWKYSPIKYWPNETNATANTEGPVDGTNNAQSSGGPDKLSFFAYAPYVKVNTTGDKLGEPTTNSSESSNDGAANASDNTGITAISKNTDKGDPKITYVVSSDPAKSVDLMWGVVPASAKYATVTGTDDQPTAGKANLNLTKQKTDEKVDFLFKHALAQIGVTITGAFDQTKPGQAAGSKEIGEKTKVTVESVKITGATLYDKGILNLNNAEANKPSWTKADGAATINLEAQIPTSIKDPTVSESEDIKEKLFGTGVTIKGITGQTTGDNAEPLSLTGENGSFMLIPPIETEGSTTNLNFEITYYVTTEDPNLRLGYSRIKNVIKKTITTSGDSPLIEAGKKYKFNLILGLTSVKVDATVETWGDTSETPVNLPINVETTSSSGGGDGD